MNVYTLYSISLSSKKSIRKEFKGVFSTDENAREAIARLAEKRTYRNADDEEPNDRPVGFHIIESELDKTEFPAASRILLYDAYGSFIEEQKGAGDSCEERFYGKDRGSCGFIRGEIVYADIHNNSTYELAVVGFYPLSPEEAQNCNATCMDDSYIVFTGDCLHYCVPPSRMFRLTEPPADHVRIQFNLITGWIVSSNLDLQNERIRKKYDDRGEVNLSSDQVSEVEEEICEKISSPRIVRTMTEFYRERRKDINEYLWKLIDKKVTPTWGSDNIQIIRHKQSGIHHKDAIHTMIEFIESVGYEKVEALDIRYQGRYGLVVRRGGGYYKEGNIQGWYVLSNCPNKFKALFINKIADALNLNVYAELVSK